MNLLEVNNLSVSLKSNNTQLVRDISFSLPKGKVIGLVGESGSGKSLTALSIIRLISSSLQFVGQLIWHNLEQSSFDIGKLDKYQLQKFRGRNVGMIFQDPGASLNPSKRVGWQVRESVLLHQNISKLQAKELVISLFKKVQLPNPERIYKSYAFQLSGGQRQRVIIAIALINNPELLIADEATTALDVTVQAEIIDLIKQLQREQNLTVLFITHDLALLNNFADKVIVMRNGIIEEQGNYSTVYETPSSSYSKGLIACRPTVNSKGFNLPMVDDFDEDSHFKPERVLTKTIGTKTKPFISASNLHVIYNKGSKNEFQALCQIDFNLIRGETLGVVGESGCGKTTLSKALLQLVKSQGSLLFDGQTVRLDSPTANLQFRKKVQFVFQDPYASLNPSIRVGSLIAEVFKVHKIGNGDSERKVFVKELLEQVGLSADYDNRYPHELSGGQRQRVAIARALAPCPELIILDEAVAALDVSVQAKVLNLLNQLKWKFGLTYIFISHNLEVVYYMSDRIMVMKDGEIVELNNSNNLYYTPKHPYTKKLIRASPF